MAKASLKLPNGTSVEIEGTTEEVRDLLQFYGGVSAHGTAPARPASAPVGRKRAKPPSPKPVGQQAPLSGPNLSEIVNLAKTCDEAEDIERQILDRTSQIDRILLPLYLVHEHLANAFELTSGDISKITKDLGVPVSQANASTTLSGSAAKYVIGDKVRKKGQAVGYKISRRGVQYLASVISGKANADKG